MRNIVACLLAGFILLSFSFAVSAEERLFFIGTDDELNVALEAAEKGMVGGIAVDQQFYFGSAGQRKNQMRALMISTRDAGSPSYFFGNDLDLDLAKEFLEFPDIPTCRSAVVVVIVRVPHTGLLGTCAIGGSKPTSSEEFRSMIAANYKYLKPRIEQMRK